MRWFKHLSAAHDDDALAAILEEMGPVGYGIYWLLLEHFAAVMEKDCTAVPELTHSEAKWANVCCCSARTFSKFAQRAAELLLISCKTLAELRQYSGRTLAKRLQIGIPKLLKYRDEYSRKSGVTPDKLPARSEREQRESREETPPTPSCEGAACEPSRNGNGKDTDPDKFSDWAEAVYARHPKKKNKFLAMQKLADRFAHDELARAIFEKNHELFRQSKSWLEQGGRFVPALCNPDDSGFISDEAWRYPPPDEEEDELMRWARDRDAARERGEIVN